ncbi:MAG: class I poly(R)-hydroxyalkanoic acid synthase [Burkholderiaceae bacterium]
MFDSVAQGAASLAGLHLPSPVLEALQSDYLEQASALWNESLTLNPQPRPDGAAVDPRFGTVWSAQPQSAFMARLYLLNARTLLRLVDSLEGDAKARARLRFAVQQWVDAAAPSNFLALNPQAQELALQTQGESIVRGAQRLWSDLREGRVTQADPHAFEVGRNVGVTPGAVVHETALFQLIDYAPTTAEVHERPLVIVPPCINKFYILDLQPHNSFVRHCVERGQRVFMLSWRNPDASLAGASWDDYVAAVVEAIGVARAIAKGARGKAPPANVLGFCIGGTLLATALAVLAARDERPAASLTLLTTFLDFADTGVLDLFIDEAMVRSRELTLGAAAPGGPALLKGRELASTFSMLRANDLVWNYVVAGYLQGIAPRALDLLHWNSDGTDLPGPMYTWYLRNTYLENNLVKPGQVLVCGEAIDLRRIGLPAYLYASREDHIVPWHGAYRSIAALGGSSHGRAPSVRFVLGASGHIAGVVNPPAAGKRCHWIGATDALPDDPEAWLAQANEKPGSWWPDWSAWLARHAGKKVAAPTARGSRDHPIIEAAPGRYVMRSDSGS